MSGAKALRHIFLFDKILIIAKKKDEGVLTYKAHINVSLNYPSGFINFYGFFSAPI